MTKNKSNASRPIFGEYLNEILWSVAARQHHKTMAAVQRELAEEISRIEGIAPPLGGDTIEYYRRGNPPDCHRIQIILDYYFRHGRPNRALAQAFIHQADCTQLDAYLDKHFGAQDRGTKSMFMNLPRPDASFLGREEEMEELFRLLSPSHRCAAIVVHGMGGIGKTTLVIHVAHQCLPGLNLRVAPAYDAVVFVSARPNVPTLSDIADEVGRVLESHQILKLEPAEKVIAVQSLLRRFRILLILDNFEDIEYPKHRALDSLHSENAQAIIRFALEGVPEPSKVIITTRDYSPRLWRGTWAIHLKGLPDPLALELVQELAREHRVESILAATISENESLVRATEGNPYAIRTALGLIANQKQHLSIVLRDLWDGRGEIFEYIFGHLWTLLDEDQKHILLALPFFTTSAARGAIGATANVAGFSLDRSLGRLTELSFLTFSEDSPNEQPRYTVHPLVIAFARERSDQHKVWEPEARSRQAHWYVQFTEERRLEDWQHFETLRNEYPNLIAVIDWALEYQYPSALSIIRNIWQSLYVNGEWNRCQRYGHAIIDTIPEPNQIKYYLWVKARLGWLYNEMGLNSQALALLLKAEQEILALHDDTFTIESRVLNFIAQAFISMADYDLARKYLERDQVMCMSIGSEWGLVLNRYYCGLVPGKLGQWAEAEQIFSSSLEATKRSGWDRATGYFYLRWSEALFHLNRLQDAEVALEQSSELAKRWHEPLLQAHAIRLQAQLAAAHGRLAPALTYALQARDIYRELGAQIELVPTNHLVEQLETALDARDS